jgi:hypothetical protein
VASTVGDELAEVHEEGGGGDEEWLRRLRMAGRAALAPFFGQDGLQLKKVGLYCIYGWRGN